MPINAYKSIVKGAAIFGGTQAFTIIVNLIRGKFVALFLGPEGMGISSLMTASMNTIQQFSSLGLNLSIIKEISNAKEVGEKAKLLLVISIARTLLRITAIIGALFTILFSRFLSNITFGNDDYRWYFIMLSIAIFFTTMSNGELSILQGYRAIKKLAYASIVGAFTGLFVGVPLYYWMGYDAIVPAMIALSLVNFLFYRNTSRRIFVERIVFKWKENYLLIKKMLLLGMTLMFAALLGTLANYILNTYIGIVLLFMAPLCCILILLSPLIIKILLTDEFMGIIPLVRWMGLGLFFKAFAFPLGYISFSKGDKKTFFWLEGVLSNLLLLLISIVSYFIWGIIGMGISLCLTYFIWGGVYIFITKRLYELRLNAFIFRLLIILIFFILLTFLSTFLNNSVFSYACMVLFTLLCSLFCLFRLNKRMNFIRFNR